MVIGADGVDREAFRPIVYYLFACRPQFLEIVLRSTLGREYVHHARTAVDSHPVLIPAVLGALDDWLQSTAGDVLGARFAQWR